MNDIWTSTGGFLTFATSMLTFVTALVALAVSLTNVRKVRNIAISVDGRLSELLELTKTSSHAEGVKEGELNAREPR